MKQCNYIFNVAAERVTRLKSKIGKIVIKHASETMRPA